MKQGSKVGIVCCSNGLGQEQAPTIDMLVQILEKSGFVPVLSPFLYGDENGYAGTARERAQALMDFYKDDEIEEIFYRIWIFRQSPGPRSISGVTVILPQF